MQVTGVLADALNWAGISEDEFNEKLEDCSSESERNQLIMETLSDTYDEASEAFYKNNKELVESREVQADLDDSLAKLGKTVSNIKTKVTSQFLPSISKMTDAFDDLLSGADGAEESLSEAIEGMVDAALDKLPDFLSFGVNIISSIADGISKNVGKLAEKIVPVLTTEIPKFFTEVAPNVIDAAFSVASALIKSLPEIVGGVIDSAVALIPNFVSGITELVPELAASVGETFGKIFEKVPDVLSTINDAIVGLVGGILEQIVFAYTGMGDVIEENTKKIQANADSVTSFADAMSSTETTLADYNSLLSENGQLIGDIDQKISETENAVTEILSQALQDQNGLREEDLENIRAYTDELYNLQLEKLGIYRDQQLAELRKLQADRDTLTQESAAQSLANAQEALEQSNAMTEEAYTAELTLLENKYKAMGEAGSAAHLQEVEELKAKYDELKLENETYYNESIALVQEKSTEWIQVDADRWEALSQGVSDFRGTFDSSIRELSDVEKNMIANINGTTAQYTSALSQMDLDTANAFFSIITEMRNSGLEIDSESKEIAANILNSFDDLPSDMDEAGKQALLGMISGLEDQIPGLENAASMSADEIVDVLKENLGIHSPSTVLREIGTNAASGLIEGIKSQAMSIGSTMLSVGSNIVSGLWSGIQSSASWLNNQISYWINSIKSSVKWLLGIHSPSTVFAGIGENMALGLGQGWDDEIQKTKKAIEGDMSFDTDIQSYGSGNSSTGFSMGNVTININGANYRDEQSLAEAISYELQKLTTRKGSVYA